MLSKKNFKIIFAKFHLTSLKSKKYFAKYSKYNLLMFLLKIFPIFKDLVYNL